MTKQKQQPKEAHTHTHAHKRTYIRNAHIHAQINVTCTYELKLTPECENWLPTKKYEHAEYIHHAQRRK